MHSAAKTSLRCRRYLRLALLPCLAVSGSLAPYAFAGGSHAATATTTTLPRPDPPPTSTQQRVSPRRSRPPVAPPPPPQPPAVETQTYATPPSAPSPPQSSSTAPLTPPQKAHHRRVIRHRQQPKEKPKAVVATAFRRIPPRELPDPARAGVVAASVVPRAAVNAETVSFRVPRPFWIVVALSLVVLAIALTPPRLLPGSVGIVVAERRDFLVYAGTAALLGIGLGLLIAQVGS
jgi:hypothetical protein